MVFTITLILTFLFFSFYQPALKIFSNNFKITFIFQCLIIHLYLIHVRILSNSYLTLDSVYNYALSYISIQERRRIEIIFESFIRAPFRCDADEQFAVAQWYFWYVRVTLNLAQAPGKVIPLITFLFATVILTVLRHIIFKTVFTGSL